MLMYVAVFFSGLVALTFQVVWQKYLSFLVGSEARSISLVVAVFLFGLATGYRYWGNFTSRELSRHTILKLVAYIELGIAVYAMAFPRLFEVVKAISYSSPDWLVVDLGITLLLLFVPTFLMGASIPLLTSALPETSHEVNYCHSRIYGINTLGAFVGAFFGGFYMVPNYGLSLTMLLGAAANVAVAMVFLFNAVEGPMRKAEPIPSIPNRFGTVGIYLFVFTTGAVSIAYELLFIRILGLSLGSGHYIFPIVLGVVILGLAIGSLSLRRGSVTGNRVFVELITLSVLLSILYFTIPHWPYWLSHIRVLLLTHPFNYPVFMGLSTLFVALFLLPVVIPMGRLLPIGYSLVDKDSSDYGRVCGRIYFVNTFGTVFGAVGLGYAMFHLLDLEQLFKLNIALVILLTAFLFTRKGNWSTAGLFVLLAVGVFALPPWNRSLHEFGMFRIHMPGPDHFRGVFHLPQQGAETLYFRDDPSATVTVNEGTHQTSTGETVTSRSIIVNGKSDGNTIGDYSNMVLTGLLPYLYAPKSSDLDAVVIGLGTGMTSGVLAATEDVRSVTTLEISHAVIEAYPLFDESTFHLSMNEKSRIVHTDAFRYFARSHDKYDIIVSEPSNPWVVGVENLFTREYYELVGRVMNEDAIFFQWVQLYEMDEDVFKAIIDNVVSAFAHVALYTIGPGDVGIVASQSPLAHPHLERRLGQPMVARALRPMALDDGPLHLLRLYDTHQLKMIAAANVLPPHTLDRSWLGHRAGRARFMVRTVRAGGALPSELGRHVAVDEQWREWVLRWLDEESEQWQQRCALPVRAHSAEFVCGLVELLREYLDLLNQPLKADTIARQLEAYSTLRERGLLDVNPQFLAQAADFTISNWLSLPVAHRQRMIELIVYELSHEWLWQDAVNVVDVLHRTRILEDHHREAFLKGIQRKKEHTEWLVERYQERLE